MSKQSDVEHFPSHSVSSPSQNKERRYEQQKESKGHSPHGETCVCGGEDSYLSIINSIQLQLPVKPMETKLESHANEFLVGDRRCFPAWGCNIPSCCNRISCFQAFCALAMKTLNNQNKSSLFRLSYSDFPVSRRLSIAIISGSGRIRKNLWQCYKKSEENSFGRYCNRVATDTTAGACSLIRK